jgi:hypothetical protein
MQAAWPVVEATMGDSSAEALRNLLLTLETEGWEALSQGTGADFYQRTLADDAVMMFPFGVLTRAESIEAMRAAPPWSTFEIEQPNVIRLTDDSALLTYRANAQRTGQDPYAAQATTVFVRRGGTWRPIFHQQSPASQS